MSVQSLLGTLLPDKVAQVLNTKFDRFVSPLGIDGLVREAESGRLEFLAIVATEPGTGQFTRFMEQCQRECHTICVWQIMNPRFEKMLGKRGFYPWSEVHRDLGETLNGMRWDRPATQSA